MHKVNFSYALSTEGSKDALLRNPLMDMLHAVRAEGSIAKAAKALELSYRGVWGALKNHEQVLGRPLIVWDKGQRARLTEFGEKLLWAERQAQARLAPQIETLRRDIERAIDTAFNTAFDDQTHLLTLYASHDAALSALREQTRLKGLHLDIRFMGSVDAIAALNAGRCMMAGFHTLDQPASTSIAAKTYRSLLKPELHKLIGFAHRTQGLIVATNNPLRIRSIADLTRSGLRYVNRAEGTGTRVLLNELLAGAGLDRAAIQGVETQEPSHAAVAQAVASGEADVGLGIEVAAHEKGLGFVPLVNERYHLVCLKSALASPPVEALLNALRASDWQTTLELLPGYSAGDAQSGKVLSLSAELPWWTYRGEKPATASKRLKNNKKMHKKLIKSGCSPINTCGSSYYFYSNFSAHRT